MSKARRGIYAAAITPIGSSGEPDLAGLVAYCRSLLRRGCDGVAPVGTTGEGQALPTPFRMKVPAALAAAGLPSDGVLVGTGSPRLSEMP